VVRGGKKVEKHCNRGIHDFFIPMGIKYNEITNRTNESMRMKDAYRIKDEPEGINMVGKKLYL